MPHVVVEGRKLYYELHGSGEGPTLVLASGSGGSCRGWLALQVPEFSKSRRTLIFDYPTLHLLCEHILQELRLAPAPVTTEVRQAVTDSKSVTRRNGYLLNKAESPYAYINVDDYEVIKP